jgi:hypothetical protein
MCRSCSTLKLQVPSTKLPPTSNTLMLTRPTILLFCIPDLRYSLFLLHPTMHIMLHVIFFIKQKERFPQSQFLVLKKSLFKSPFIQFKNYEEIHRVFKNYKEIHRVFKNYILSLVNTSVFGLRDDLNSDFFGTKNCKVEV